MTSNCMDRTEALGLCLATLAAAPPGAARFGYDRSQLRPRIVHLGLGAFFRAHGATATDHGHPTAATANLSQRQAGQLFARVLARRPRPADAELFRAQMLTEMARMSCDDGMVMQLQ